MSPKALDEPTPLSAKVSLTIGRRLVLYVYLVTSLFFATKSCVYAWFLSDYLFTAGTRRSLRKESCVTFKTMRLLWSSRSIIYNSDVSICTLPGFHSVFEHDGSVSSLSEELWSRSRRSASPPSSSSPLPFVPS